MKKIIIAAVLMVLTIQPSMANEDNNPIAMCDAMGVLTEVVMNMRQAGEPLSEMLKDAKGIEVALIKNAYEYPVFKGADERLISEAIFSADWRLRCLKSLVIVRTNNNSRNK